MVHASWQHDHVTLRALYPDPAVLLVPDIEVAAAVQYESYLLVAVEVLLKEALNLIR